ncbi:hypothetical protein [Deinococcus aestuarii]|uniref:hypothetical protein n=1 Tax=Deinococcus aestuarii TaxID=2774531 RepID=UPI001C0B089C|nr:hypothetical protein [Deinococcus aestuarii]
MRAYDQLGRASGRQAFSVTEIAEAVPEYKRGTISAHLCSFMADGKNHSLGYGEVERVERGQYQLTAKGRKTLQDLLAGRL